MINLLPPSYKKRLGEEHSFKMALILATLAIAVLLSFSLILSLMQIFFAGREKAFEIAADGKEQEIKILDVDNIEKKIGATNTIVASLEEIFSRQIRIGDVFRQTARAIPAGVTLESFSFAAGKVSLAGIAATREALADFKSKLESQSAFRDVNFPPESWIDETDIKFTATFKYGI